MVRSRVFAIAVLQSLVVASVLVTSRSLLIADDASVKAPVVVVRSERSGKWSDPATWSGRRPPQTGESVKIRPGHTVVYDVESNAVIRAVHVGGTLEFSREVSTRLECGLIRIQEGEGVTEEGFDCDMHSEPSGPDSAVTSAALIVGTRASPIPRERSALIRLHHLAGMDVNSCPAIVCCGGRMEFHGAPLSRTWIKLRATAGAEASEWDPLESTCRHASLSIL